MEDCIFCRIVAGEMGTDLVYGDDRLIAFADLAPQAPVHCLIVPRVHVANLSAASGDPGLLGHLLQTAAQLARDLGLTAGYRVVINTGSDGGQTVAHLHVHLLGGRRLRWPPG